MILINFKYVSWWLKVWLSYKQCFRHIDNHTLISFHGLNITEEQFSANDKSIFLAKCCIFKLVYLKKTESFLSVQHFFVNECSNRGVKGEMELSKIYHSTVYVISTYVSHCQNEIVDSGKVKICHFISLVITVTGFLITTLTRHLRHYNKLYWWPVVWLL